MDSIFVIQSNLLFNNVLCNEGVVFNVNTYANSQDSGDLTCVSHNCRLLNGGVNTLFKSSNI